MEERLFTLKNNELNQLDEKKQLKVLQSLESGRVIYLPDLTFKLQPEEQCLLSENILHPKHKNISYDYLRNHLAGTQSAPMATMCEVMKRFATFTKQLVDQVLPHYSPHLQWGRTSYRPAEILGRKTSKRKDDTRLHVDSFAATPVNGLRIFRVFSNINPHGQPRVWHLGEPFADVLNHFAPRIKPYRPLQAQWLKWLKATKTLRTAYDHFMLQLHDSMKLDDEYQNTVSKQRIDFPSQSTWLVFTDHVSHAAISGQYLLEQTFYLPVSAMQNTQLSPLAALDRI